MDEKAVSKALFKKISALRVTLTDEEQEMLDQIVSGDYEVNAHRMTNAEGRVAMDDKVVTQRSIALNSRIAAEPDEVMAHAMTSRVAFRVTYDGEKKVYLVQ